MASLLQYRPSPLKPSTHSHSCLSVTELYTQSAFSSQMSASLQLNTETDIEFCDIGKFVLYGTYMACWPRIHQHILGHNWPYVFFHILTNYNVSATSVYLQPHYTGNLILPTTSLYNGKLNIMANSLYRQPHFTSNLIQPTTSQATSLYRQPQHIGNSFYRQFQYTDNFIIPTTSLYQ